MVRRFETRKKTARKSQLSRFHTVFWIFHFELSILVVHKNKFYIILKPFGNCIISYSCLSTIHFYIILKLIRNQRGSRKGLSTIHFYIILKQSDINNLVHRRLSTIHFYIILKPSLMSYCCTVGLSTIHFYIILKRISGHAATPLSFKYHTFFTSFSNTRRALSWSKTV